MSKLAMLAVSATSIVAISFFEPTTFTFLTVMPPAFVVPVTRKSTAALLSNPLPVTVTSRLMVPCVADDGSAAAT